MQYILGIVISFQLTRVLNVEIDEYLFMNQWNFIAVLSMKTPLVGLMHASEVSPSADLDWMRKSYS
jgi:hypothetical protein